MLKSYPPWQAIMLFSKSFGLIFLPGILSCLNEHIGKPVEGPLTTVELSVVCHTHFVKTFSSRMNKTCVKI
jgi:hypothetical protein